MKMKRYTAPDMRQALKMVRDEQGADAVILASRRVDGRVEITVAVDDDAADGIAVTPFAAAPRRTRPQRPRRRRPASRRCWRSAPRAQRPSAGRAAGQRGRERRAQDAAPDAGDAAGGARLERPDAARAARHGAAARTHRDRLRRRRRGADRRPRCRRRSISPVRVASPSRAWPIDCRSPATAGASTAASSRWSARPASARALRSRALAARWVMRHGSQDLALVCADAQRPGAHEQTARLGRLLGAATFRVEDLAELPRAARPPREPPPGPDRHRGPGLARRGLRSAACRVAGRAPAASRSG